MTADDAIVITFRTTTLSEADFDDFVHEVFNYVVGISPFDTGLFTRSWEIRVTYPRAVIWNDLPYAIPLDEGWSKQAPRGITQPTREFIRELRAQY
jgi:hypothetical protein